MKLLITTPPSIPAFWGLCNRTPLPPGPPWHWWGMAVTSPAPENLVQLKIDTVEHMVLRPPQSPPVGAAVFTCVRSPFLNGPPVPPDPFPP